MATTYYTSLYNSKVGAATSHGAAKQSVHLHAISGSISTWATNDMINIGYLPRGAVVVSGILKAASQLDCNGSPTLTLRLGIPGTTRFSRPRSPPWAARQALRRIPPSAPGGLLYVSPTTAVTPVIVTVHAAAATAVAGTIEVDLEYYQEDVAGPAP